RTIVIFFYPTEDGIRAFHVTGVQTCALPISDAVEQAGSGHPGTAMSLAPAAYLLFQEFLRHDPPDPDWPGRDRFVLSVGHSSLKIGRASCRERERTGRLATATEAAHIPARAW